MSVTDQLLPAPFVSAPHFAPPHIAYGFFGRKGGVSTGLYDSLNCGFGSQDDTHLIAENRKYAAASLGISAEQLASVYQVHSADVITIETADQIAHRPKADGLVTALPDIALTILTADCTPLLFCDDVNGIIGACHAGWRGAAQGVIQNTVTAMQDLGATAQNCHCFIGPTIAKASYQVGADMRDAALQSAPHAADFFEPDPSDSTRFLFDLPAFAHACASAAGLHNIWLSGHDTYGESKQFFSHRRATHLHHNDTGRQMAVIMRRAP